MHVPETLHVSGPAQFRPKVFKTVCFKQFGLFQYASEVENDCLMHICNLLSTFHMSGAVKVLTVSPLVTSDAGHLFMHLLAMCVSC